MKQNSNLNNWKNLYDTAIQVKELAPWKWMYDLDLFCVENPDSGELGFISVMGARGEHFAISLYLGIKAIYNLRHISSLPADSIPHQSAVELPQIQVSFEDSDLLEKEDFDLIKRLKLKFRGRNAWPFFRSYRFGIYPGKQFLDAEVLFLTYALEQLLDVAVRYKDNGEDLFEMANKQEFLVRVPIKGKNALEWHDQIRKLPPP